MREDTLPLLGDGADLTGRSVQFFGRTWTITGKNYLGDWDVEAIDVRADGNYIIRSSISPHQMPVDHGHYAELLTTHKAP